MRYAFSKKKKEKKEKSVMFYAWENNQSGKHSYHPFHLIVTALSNEAK